METSQEQPNRPKDRRGCFGVLGFFFGAVCGAVLAVAIVWMLEPTDHPSSDFGALGVFLDKCMIAFVAGSVVGAVIGTFAGARAGSRVK